MFACEAVDLDFLNTAPIRVGVAGSVARPPSEVFAAVAHDPANWGEFFPGFDKTGRYHTPVPHGVGARRTMRFTGVKFEETILAWDEGARWAFRVDSAQAPVFDAFVEDYHFEPLQTFSRTLPRFAALGPAEFDGAVWPVFDDLADLVARGFAALERGEPAYERLRAIVRGPAPDVSGGVRHVASDRHAAYLHRESLSGLIRDLRRRLGWPERLVASSAIQTLTA
jgi:hypothetical protein